MIAGAGNETTARLIGFMGQLLSDHPDQRRELVADPSLIPGAVEETLRYEPPSPVQARYVAHDAEHYGHVVPEGSFMLLLNGSANRDEHRFPDPDRYDIHRQGSHLELRAGPAFLPRLGAGPAGSSGGLRRGPQTLAGLGSRLRQRRTGAHRERARVGTLTRLHRLEATRACLPIVRIPRQLRSLRGGVADPRSRAVRERDASVTFELESDASVTLEKACRVG